MYLVGKHKIPPTQCTSMRFIINLLALLTMSLISFGQLCWSEQQLTLTISFGDARRSYNLPPLRHSCSHGMTSLAIPNVITIPKLLNRVHPALRSTISYVESSRKFILRRKKRSFVQLLLQTGKGHFQRFRCRWQIKEAITNSNFSGPHRLRWEYWLSARPAETRRAKLDSMIHEWTGI